MTPVRFEPITAGNWRAVVALSLEPHQRPFVAENVFSIAQSKVEPWWETYAVYAGDDLVGFTMFGLDSDSGCHWICRLMIDRERQRRGFGRAAMEEVLARLDERPERGEIRISFVPENAAARALYSSLGFEDRGIVDDGEVVLVLPDGARRARGEARS
jgi:diamine N-acetyltransferase